MGSSGSSLDKSRPSPEEMARRVRDGERQTKNQEFDVAVNDMLSTVLKDYNDRDTAAMAQHIDTVRSALDKDIERAVSTQFGGSVAKHTAVDGLSDVDALVDLSNTDLAGKTPDEAKGYFADRLRERLPETEIVVGTLAVTVRFGDGVELQLLPAFKTKDGLRIPSTSGNTWSGVIDPKAFATQLTEVNQKCGGKVVPIIKVAKAIIAELPERYRLSGYHVEALAVAIFKTYSGRQNLREMLTHLFANVPDHVKTPIKDSTGQSSYVDSHLGNAGSSRRESTAKALERIGRRMDNANGHQSAEMWRDIVGVEE